MTKSASDVAFTSSVKAEQQRRGSRAAYERVEQGSGWPSEIADDLAALLSGARSIYFGTASAEGQPYIQHRGGPPGFLQVIDKSTLGFADFAGNRQYITVGNLAENPRAFIFLMDYSRQLRVKLWGRARVVEHDDDLIARLRPATGALVAERAILFSVAAWDRNCRQHIPRLVPMEAVEATLRPMQQRISELEAEVHRLRSGR